VLLAMDAVKQIVCRVCSAEIDVADSFCRHCGTPTTGRGDLAIAADTRSRATPIDSPWVVLGLLFFVLGPFALPVLYKSRAFNTPVKIALTIVVLIIAVVAVWVTLYLVGQVTTTLKEAWAEWPTRH